VRDKKVVEFAIYFASR